jgi:predicted Zn-dependent peptidase
MRPKSFAAALLVLVVLLAAAGRGAETLKLDVQEFALDNGLTILLVERHQVPTVSVCLTYRVGSADESSGITGIAHFVEHLYDKGTPVLGTTDPALEQQLIAQKDEVMAALRAERDKPKPDAEKVAPLEARYAELKARHEAITVSGEIDKLLTEAGASDKNATTSYDRTNYFTSLPANRLELWCAIFSQIMRGPVFREFYEEQQVIIEERRMRVDNSPDGALWEALMATSYTSHPYHHPILGWASDMANYTREQVNGFYTRYYAPNRAVLSVVGDVTAKDAVALIRKYFGNIPRQPPPDMRRTAEPAPRGERIVTVEFDAQPSVCSAWLTVPLADPDYVVFDVIGEILTGGRTGRLYKRLVEEEQLAVSINSGITGLRDTNIFLYGATPKAPHTVQEVDAAVLDELEKLKAEPVSERELQRAKNQLAAGFVRAMESNLDLATILGAYEVTVGWKFLDDYVARTEAVTADDVQRIARAYFGRTNRTLGYVVPKNAAPPTSEAAGGSE